MELEYSFHVSKTVVLTRDVQVVVLLECPQVRHVPVDAEVGAPQSLVDIARLVVWANALLAEQPMEWNPDLNDGVRLNIRPFFEAGVPREKAQKLNIKWGKDRGKDLPSALWSPSSTKTESTTTIRHLPGRRP